VVVDFWATWCQPCRMLSPILERLAVEHQGRFVLVKARTEDMPEVTAAFNVQAVPTVYAVRDGKIVGQFVGLLPEANIRAWIEQILPSPVETLIAQARTQEASSLEEAEAQYRRAIEVAPNRPEARIGLARVLLARGQIDQSQQILDELASSDLLDAEGRRLRAEVLLRQAARQGHGVQEAQAAFQADPENRSSQLNLAWALAAEGRYREALDLGLQLVKEDRQGVGPSARELMVQLFHLLGSDNELTSQYRRKLAMALY